MTNLSITTSATKTTTIPEAASRSARAARTLRGVLLTNATTSAVSGVAGLIGASYWSERLGIDNVAITAVISGGLVLFAAAVVFAARVPDESLKGEALLVSLADIGWVAASAVVIALGFLTTFGTVAAVVIALMVADFAAMQLWLRRRL
jgi:hypothetical protein